MIYDTKSHLGLGLLNADLFLLPRSVGFYRGCNIYLSLRREQVMLVAGETARPSPRIHQVFFVAAPANGLYTALNFCHLVVGQHMLF